MADKLLPEIPPHIQGQHGRAWRFDVAAIHARYGGAPLELSISNWAVHAPWAHPAWHSYLVSGISLRKVPGWKYAKINLSGATHEILIFALNPDKPILLDDRPALLTPANFIGQFIEPDDATAAAKIERAVVDICDGRLSPDTDFIRHWIHRFSDSNVLDKEHAGETRIIVGDQVLVLPPHPGPQDMH